MLTFSLKLQTFVLPIGFAFIISFMIGTAMLTSSRITNTNETIIKNQVETNSINSYLDIMSDANKKRSNILFKLVHNQDTFKLNTLISEMILQAIRFKKARDNYTSYSLSQKQEHLLNIQSEMTEKNIESINEMVIDLIDKKNDKAASILNYTTLPRSEHIQSLINNLSDIAKENARIKAEQTKNISTKVSENIIQYNLFSILICFLLMIFLIRKQTKSDINLSKLATTDTLTELPNRASFIKSIDKTIVKSNQSGSLFALVFFDIDYFKSINDIYGHEVGDKVLTHFSSTILNQIKPKDILARFGGDEFVLLLRQNYQKDDFAKTIKRLSKALDTSYMIDFNEIFITSSIGISVYPDDGDSITELLKNADIAMYSAKQSGRNCYQYFSLEDSKKLEYEHSISLALQTIFTNNNKDNQLSLAYQPLVNFDDNRFNECEALIRWTDQDGYLVNTTEFIEIAEKSNLIQEVNMFVIEEACRQQSEWQNQGINNIRININLSGNKRIFDELFDSLLENLNFYNLNPKQFGIELTERTIYEVSEETILNLKHFKELGMKVAIDDFGTGYSSLSYLKDLPVTTLKIDKEFITGLPDDKIDTALVNAIITLAHSIGLDVVAEGIETQGQYDFLKENKCNIAQGYLLHRPLNSQDITELKLVA